MKCKVGGNKMKDFDTGTFSKTLFELYGGKDKFAKETDSEVKNFNKLWNQNYEKIGRVMRSHLVVEHFLTEYLVQESPKLNVEDARLTFGQKINLLRNHDKIIAMLRPGIERLNKIRNRLAHNLNAEITEADAKV